MAGWNIPIGNTSAHSWWIFQLVMLGFGGCVCVFPTRIDQGELDLSAFEGDVVLLKGF